MSLEGTGVESFRTGFALGKKLALVVSWRQEELESGETFSRVVGEEFAPGPGDDFWKKDMIERCFADDETDDWGLAEALAGVRAVLALSPAMMGNTWTQNEMQKRTMQ